MIFHYILNQLLLTILIQLKIIPIIMNHQLTKYISYLNLINLWNPLQIITKYKIN
jgi:hypothetical protein